MNIASIPTFIVTLPFIIFAVFRERHIASVGAQMPNWPLEKYPILYHDIDAEIPADHRAMVRKFYLICLCTFGLTHARFYVFYYLSN